MEYTVTITGTLTRPINDLDDLVDLLPNSGISLSEDSELSITSNVEADNVLVAGSLAHHTVLSVLDEVDTVLDPVIELEVVETERHDRRLEESNLPDLVSAPEVGEILGVSRQRVHQLINENASFPPPLLRLGSGPLWLRATIEAWASTWTRRPGRPRRELAGVEVHPADLVSDNVKGIRRRTDAGIDRMSRGK